MKNKLILITLFLISSFGFSQNERRNTPPISKILPKVNLTSPDTLTLNNGLKVIFIPNQKLPKVSYFLLTDAPPKKEGEKAGLGTLAANMLGKGTKNQSNEEFNEELDFMGVDMLFTKNSVYATCLSKYKTRTLQLLAESIRFPRFKIEDFEKEKQFLLNNLKTIEKSVPDIARRVENALAYGKNHPFGEITTKETVNAIKFDDISFQLKRKFVPNHSYLIIIGQFEIEAIKPEIETNFTGWSGISPRTKLPQPKNIDSLEVNFINMPNAVQSEIKILNTIPLKMNSPDFFPLLLANKILGGGSENRLFLNLREDKGFTYGAYSSIKANPYIGIFYAHASVRNSVTDRAIIEFLKEIDEIKTNRVSNEELQNAKEKLKGNFIMSLEDDRTQAFQYFNIKTHSLSSNFYNTYLDKINNVTADEVLLEAQKYFLLNNMRIIVTGNIQHLLLKLHKLTFKGREIPLKFYDEYANPTEQPIIIKDIPKGITLDTVVNKYLNKIGGRSSVKKIKKLHTVIDTNVGTQNIKIISKTTNDNKYAIILKYREHILNKQVINNNRGYMINQPVKKGYMADAAKRIDLNREEIDNIKQGAVLFPEMYLTTNAKLDRIETHKDNRDYYVIEYNEKKVAYYDFETGLKTQEIIYEKENSNDEVSKTIISKFSNYKNVDGVLFPYTITQRVEDEDYTLLVKEININKNIEEKDFE